MTKKIAPQPGLVECGSCGGEGYREERDEDARGRLVREACYHCGTTGFIDAETARKDRIAGAAELLACDIIDRRRDNTNKAAIENQDGEGWGFAAAENMMSEHDYTTARIMEMTATVVEAFMLLNPSIVDAIVDRIDPPKKDERKPA